MAHLHLQQQKINNMIKTDKTFWLARDKDGDLTLFTHKPYFNESPGFIPGWDVKTLVNGKDEWIEAMRLDPRLYPEVTFENSPIEVKFSFIKNE